MKIMVTGGAGFIGSNVVDGYVAAGHDVVVVDDLSAGKRANVHPEARFFKMDVRSREAADLVMEERPDVLNHHAAQISVPDSVRDPVLDADINIRGLLNLLEAAVRAKTRKVIFISSGGAIYGEATEYPTSEAYAPRPLSPYAVSKVACENYLAYYRHQWGLDYVTLRYANIYGPRQIPHGEAGVVAIFMDNLLRGDPSTLYHFPEDEEGMIRDYCYVGDVVTANLLALERGSGESVNIGSGEGTKTGRLYDLVYRAVEEARPGTGSALAQPKKALARPGDLQRSTLRVGKAWDVLGWKPVCSLPQGLRKTLEWRLREPNG